MFFIKRFVLLLFLTGCTAFYVNKDFSNNSIYINGLEEISFYVNDTLFKYNTSDLYSTNSFSSVNGFSIKRRGILKVNINNYNFCLFNGEVVNLSLFSDCNFLYILKMDNFNIAYIGDNIDAIIYDDNIVFSNQFLERVYINWIDLFSINESKKITINLSGDYSISYVK